MYEIQMTSTENQSSSKPFQTTIKITADNRHIEEQISQILLQEEYFLHTYLNPVFWILNFSPMFVYISQYQSEMEASNQLLKMNEEMLFQFKRKSHCKYFESVIIAVLTKFMDKKLAESNKEKLSFPTKELISH
ncbi:hypothetical protein [Bacillus benzoevorans]|uniref:Uncharacterized protein n=1 Tax=Bacillus benzoevorans TaxID=1456 RepID=A0A7X0LY36_9BACI|nr:hypothetical protein [Bacillus benzoevorans]MBB6447102.1 hypothetical protein [Bacillus benzoevorans]